MGVNRCPRCGWAKQPQHRLCLLCYSEDKLLCDDHPIHRGNTYHEQFENCPQPQVVPGPATHRKLSAHNGAGRSGRDH